MLLQGFAEHVTLIGSTAGAVDASVRLFVLAERGDNAALSRTGSTANLDTTASQREHVALARVDTLLESLQLKELM